MNNLEVEVKINFTQSIFFDGEETIDRFANAIINGVNKSKAARGNIPKTRPLRRGRILI